VKTVKFSQIVTLKIIPTGDSTTKNWCPYLGRFKNPNFWGEETPVETKKSSHLAEKVEFRRGRLENFPEKLENLSRPKGLTQPREK